MKQKYAIKGITVDFNTLKTKEIEVIAGSKNNDFNGLRLKYNNLETVETHQQVIFLKNGRVVKIFDKNTVKIIGT